MDWIGGLAQQGLFPKGEVGEWGAWVIFGRRPAVLTASQCRGAETHPVLALGGRWHFGDVFDVHGKL